MKTQIKDYNDFLQLTDCGVNDVPSKYPCIACGRLNSMGNVKYTYVYLSDFEINKK